MESSTSSAYLLSKWKTWKKRYTVLEILLLNVLDSPDCFIEDAERENILRILDNHKEMLEEDDEEEADYEVLLSQGKAPPPPQVAPRPPSERPPIQQQKRTPPRSAPPSRKLPNVGGSRSGALPRKASTTAIPEQRKAKTPDPPTRRAHSDARIPSKRTTSKTAPRPAPTKRQAVGNVFLSHRHASQSRSRPTARSTFSSPASTRDEEQSFASSAPAASDAKSHLDELDAILNEELAIDEYDDYDDYDTIVN